MTDLKEKKRGLFSPILTLEDALKIIKDASYAFYFLAAIQVAVGIFLKMPTVVDAVLYVVLGVLLHIFKSRIAAVALLALSGITLFITVMNKLGLSNSGGANIFLAIIVVVIAARAVEATFKIHGLFRETSKNA